MILCYFRNTNLVNGSNHFQFASPFDWDGNSNLILEMNFTSGDTLPDAVIEGDEITNRTAVVSTNTDHYAEFAGNQQHIELSEMEVDFSNGLTMFAWVNYDNFNNWSRIIDLGNGPNSDNILLANQGTTSNLVLSVRIGGNATEFSAPNSLISGEWMLLSCSVGCVRAEAP